MVAATSRLSFVLSELFGTHQPLIPMWRPKSRNAAASSLVPSNE
ncbi:unnamed protein product [Ixodes persulcatus]